MAYYHNFQFDSPYLHFGTKKYRCILYTCVFLVEVRRVELLSCVKIEKPSTYLVCS